MPERRDEEIEISYQQTNKQNEQNQQTSIQSLGSADFILVPGIILDWFFDR